jgi:hypothetical protein
MRYHTSKQSSGNEGRNNLSFVFDSVCALLLPGHAVAVDLDVAGPSRKVASEFPETRSLGSHILCNSRAGQCYKSFSVPPISSKNRGSILPGCKRQSYLPMNLDLASEARSRCRLLALALDSFVGMRTRRFPAWPAGASGTAYIRGLA